MKLYFVLGFQYRNFMRNGLFGAAPISSFSESEGREFKPQIGNDFHKKHSVNLTFESSMKLGFEYTDLMKQLPH